MKRCGVDLCYPRKRAWLRGLAHMCTHVHHGLEHDEAQDETEESMGCAFKTSSTLSHPFLHLLLITDMI